MIPPAACGMGAVCHLHLKADVRGVHVGVASRFSIEGDGVVNATGEAGEPA